jgi:hypothetical protein
MKKIQKRKLFLNRETVKELTLRSEVRGGRNGYDLTIDTKKMCSVGSCLKDRYTNCM